MILRAHIIVSGVVQGVGFRFFVQHVAKRFGLVGYVRNLYSGDVEIEAEGERSLLEELIKEVKIGPRLAHVSDVKVEWLESTGKEKDFIIK